MNMTTKTSETSFSYAIPPYGKTSVCDYCGQKKIIEGYIIKYKNGGKDTESKKICKDCLQRREL